MNNKLQWMSQGKCTWHYEQPPTHHLFSWLLDQICDTATLNQSSQHLWLVSDLQSWHCNISDFRGGRKLQGWQRHIRWEGQQLMDWICFLGCLSEALIRSQGMQPYHLASWIWIMKCLLKMLKCEHIIEFQRFHQFDKWYKLFLNLLCGQIFILH